MSHGVEDRSIDDVRAQLSAQGINLIPAYEIGLEGRMNFFLNPVYYEISEVGDDGFCLCDATAEHIQFCPMSDDFSEKRSLEEIKAQFPNIGERAEETKKAAASHWKFLEDIGDIIF